MVLAGLIAGVAGAGSEPLLKNPIPLWVGTPPMFKADASPEIVNEKGSIENVSVPAISLHLPPPDKNTGMALIVCPGGGYRALDWNMHIVNTADCFNPKGVAIIGLKYRTRPPNGNSNPEIQAVTLLDVKRAVRLVRARAAEWNIDPHKIGVAGFSAGANLTMNLAANFDEGDPQARDPVDRQSSRPDFAVGLATWSWHAKESPFNFKTNTPPVFMVHATNDFGAPIDLPRDIKAKLEALNVPVYLAEFDDGAHGVGNLIPTRIKNNFPGTRWPDLLLEWLNHS